MTQTHLCAQRAPARSPLARACDTLVAGLGRRGLHLASLAALAMLPAWQANASSVTVGVNGWLGSASSDWFNASNWSLGVPGIINLPFPVLPTAIGPIEVTVDGQPAGFLFPQREAVLGAAFTTPSFTMFAFDGLSQLRLGSGAVLDAPTATIGQIATNYTPTGAVQAATLVLDGGQTSGNWSFLANSRVVVNAQYTQGQGNWSGTLGALVVSSGASFVLGSSLTVNSLVNDSNSLVVNAGTTFHAAGAVVNNGTLTLAGNGSYGNSRLQLGADTTLAGNGSTVLASDGSGYDGQVAAGDHTLTVGADQALRGSGSVSGSVVNLGRLQAEGARGLTLSPGNGRSFDNSAGLVQVDAGSVLALDSGTLSGGRLHGSSAAAHRGALQGTTTALLTGGGSFQDLALSGNLAVAAGGAIHIAGTITNNGVLTLNGDGSYGNSTAHLSADTVLAGSGSTLLASDGSGYGGQISNNVYTLTIATGHTLRGSGAVMGNVVIQGRLVADGTLLLQPYGGGRSTVDNSTGLVQLRDGATLALSGNVVLSGGTVQSLGAGKLAGSDSSSSFKDLTLQGSFTATGATFDGVRNTGSLTVNAGNTIHGRGTLTNDGLLRLVGDGTYGNGTLYLAGDTTLAGSGTTALAGDGSGYSGQISNNVYTLTIATGHTLRGSGAVMGNVVNQGRLVADGTLLLQPYGGGRSTVDNSTGLVQLRDGATLALSSNVVLSGGTVQSLGAGTLAGSDSSSSFKDLTLQGNLATTGGSFDGVTIAGSLSVTPGSTIHGRGTLTNDGLLRLVGNGTYGNGTLYLAGDTTLAGSGTTTLAGDGSGYSGQISNNVYTLTIAAGHTLGGSGDIFGNVVNQGRLVADGTLALRPYGGVDNTVDNRGGLIQISAGSTLLLDTGTLSGGTLRGSTAAGGAAVPAANAGQLVGSGSFKDLALAGNLAVAAGSAIRIAGTITNSGLLTLNGNGTYGSSTAFLAADSTLAGSGSTLLASDGSGYGGQFSNNGHTLTIASGHTLRGSGAVIGTVVNRGSIVADGTLLLQPYAGGAANSVDNSAGLVQLNDGATLALSGATVLSGGTVQSLGSGTLAGSGSSSSFKAVTLQGSFSASGATFDGATNAGSLTVGAGSTIYGRGTFTNTGALRIGGNGTYGNGTLALDADTTLTGGGSTWLTTSQGYGGRITTGSHTLTVEHGQTLGGAGTITGTLIDHGTLAPGDTVGQLTLDGSLVFGSDALLAIDATGLVQGSHYDWLAVSGNASLAGNVQLAFGYEAQVGDSFTFMTIGGTRTGSFNAVTAAGYQLSLSYGANDVTATVTAITAVPEPASWALMAAGLLALGGVARRTRVRAGR